MSKNKRTQPEHKYGNHVVPVSELSRTMAQLTSQCRECRYLATDHVVLCGWHENSHAISKAMRPISNKDDL